MASDDASEAIGAIFLLIFMVAAALAAIAIVLLAGSVIGFGVSLANYGKAFQANVHLERPGVK